MATRKRAYITPVEFKDDPLLLSDREINKHTGIWKRAQEQMGIPRSAETKAKISAALKGRSLSAQTKAKISASLKRRRRTT